MPHKPGCIFIGLCTVDQLALISAPLREDEKVRADAIVTDGGGPAATAACAAANLGLASSLLTVLGEDEWLPFSLASLKACKVRTEMVRVSKKFRTPVSLIFINTKTAARTIIWNSGGIEKFDFALTPAELRALATAPALHFDGHVMQLALKLAAAARKNGGLVSYDCGSVKPGWEKLAALSGVLIASHKFARQISLSPQKTARLLRERFGGKTAVTCGEKGLWYCGGETAVPVFLPQRKYRAVDTTGCGDVFHGAFLADYLRGAAFPDALAFAQRAAGLKTLAPGGRKPLLDPKISIKLKNTRGVR